MSTRKSRPGRGGLRDHGRNQSNSIERPETLEQARRWDVQKSRALAHGLCERCAGQYSWGLQIGFTHSRPPCPSCAVIVAATVGEARPNGWINMRLSDVGSADTTQVPHAHRSRRVTPEKYVEGYGTCQCGTSWTGYEACHCAGCHHTFAGERAFVKHRVRGRCQDPESRGLVKIHRSHWTGWGWPRQRDRREPVRG